MGVSYTKMCQITCPTYLCINVQVNKCMWGMLFIADQKKAIFDPNGLSLTHFLKANLKEILEWLLWGHYLTFLFQHNHYQMNSKFFPIIKVGKSLHSILECASADFAHDNSCCPPLPVSRSSVSEV